MSASSIAVPISKPDNQFVTGHLAALDGLRGLAILIVILFHCTIITPVSRLEKLLVSISPIGSHGVDLFFVLSGFLITGILIDSKGKPHYFRNFYMRRTLRIFPLYYAVIAFSFLILPAMMVLVPAASGKLARFAGVTHNWPWYVAYASNFLIAKEGAFRHGVLDVTWSLAIEEQFYLLWALVVYRLSRQRVEQVSLWIVGLALICRVAMYLSGWNWIAIYVLTPSRMDALALGSFLAARMRAGEDAALKLVPIARYVGAIGLIILGSFVAFGLLDYERAPMISVGYTTVGLVCASGLVLALNQNPLTLGGTIITSGFLRFLGKYSYALYLFHLPIRAVIRDLFFGDAQFRQLPGTPILWQCVFYVVAIGATIPAALLSWHLLEKRMLKLKRFFPL